jgi:propionyl-CoA carboxylase alpha chain
VITRLLIANRGEIVVRVARSAHRLGISTVGVYSEPDAGSLHASTVDLAVALGGATPAESYLRVDAVIEAAIRTGADAVHPGYGFLAENAGFARAVVDAGLIWVGPTPEQIELLGDKVAAKEAAVGAGVPTTAAVLVTPDTLPDDLHSLTGGRPALVKAAAGGGGRGMRVVHDVGELADAVVAASREAESAFGDGTVFIEAYIERGRHVEVQILGDHHGNVIHFGERECSVQRRNQKVLEEAPSAGIDPATRELLCEGALALARHVGYHSAGTVEFMVSDTEEGEAPTISFLEVNTRLQVEHPVTEAVTGVDLVELQLKVAVGEPLGMTQSDVHVEGHAIEVRLVAEDPAKGWLPSTGVVERFGFGDGVRVDSGVASGSVVSADYDSLLAKVVAHAPTRLEAARRLARALRTADLAGVRTDADCLVDILGEVDFLAARTPTAYLAEHPEVATGCGPEGDDRVAQLAAATFHLERQDRLLDRSWGFAPSGWRNLRIQGQRREWRDRATDEVVQVEYVVGASGSARLWLGDWPTPDPETGELGQDLRRVLEVRHGADWVALDGVRRVVEVVEGAEAGVLHVRSSAGRTTWELAPRFVGHDASEASGGPVSPLPGSVVSVHVEVGEEVGDGDLLVVIEAMKMEHRITARTGATVTEVLVAPGDKVDAGTVLVLLESS